MRVIRTLTYFMAVLAVAALVNSTSGVFCHNSLLVVRLFLLPLHKKLRFSVPRAAG